MKWPEPGTLLGFRHICCEYPVLAGFDTWRRQVVKKLAEAIYAFATTNICLKLVLLALNIPLYFLLGRLIFGSWDRFLGVLRKSIIIYLLGPLIFLFYRKRDRIRSALVTNREIGLSTLVDFLWVGLYALEYLIIRSLFIS